MRTVKSNKLNEISVGRVGSNLDSETHGWTVKAERTAGFRPSSLQSYHSALGQIRAAYGAAANDRLWSKD